MVSEDRVLLEEDIKFQANDGMLQEPFAGRRREFLLQFTNGWQPKNERKMQDEKGRDEIPNCIAAAACVMTAMTRRKSLASTAHGNASFSPSVFSAPLVA
jgi:hypothetical protein